MASAPAVSRNVLSNRPRLRESTISTEAQAMTTTAWTKKMENVDRRRVGTALGARSLRVIAMRLRQALKRIRPCHLLFDLIRLPGYGRKYLRDTDDIEHVGDLIGLNHDHLHFAHLLHRKCTVHHLGVVAQ
jgi:hypothetical protein